MDAASIGRTAPRFAAATPDVAELARRRIRVSLILTMSLLVVFFGFLLLVAYAKAWLGTQLAVGVSLALVLAVAVLFIAWLLAWLYVRWANRYHDPLCDQLRRARAP